MQNSEKTRSLKAVKVALSGFMSVVLTLYMPAMVFAGEYDIQYGDITITATDNNSHTVDYSDNEGVKQATDSSPVVTGTSDRYNVTLDAAGGDVNVTFSDLNVNATTNGEAAVNVTGSNDVTIELEGGSTLTGGIDHAGIEDNLTGTLTIKDADNDGTLTAIGRNNGAGIGGGMSDSGSDITIESGTVTATGGTYGAGIGGGYHGNGSNITIGSGTVTATGGTFGAGIGGGSQGNGSNITIESGTVTATGGNHGAGIGGGNYGDGSNITIESGTVTATGGNYGAGIGGGENGCGNAITIEGGNVITTGGTNGAGIGGGLYKTGRNIKISGPADVSAAGGTNSVAIGNGWACHEEQEDPDVTELYTTGRVTKYGPGTSAQQIAEGSVQPDGDPIVGTVMPPAGQNPVNHSQHGGSAPAVETTGTSGDNSNESSIQTYSMGSTSAVTASSILAQIANALAVDPGATSVTLDLGTDPSLGVDAIRALCEGNSVVKECYFTHDGKRYVLVIPVVDKESTMYKLCLEVLAKEPGSAAGPIKLSQIFAPVGFDLKEE